MKSFFIPVIMAGAVLTTSVAAADPLSLKVLLGAPQESIKMNFDDGSKHFVLMVRREGSADAGRAD